MSRGSKLSRLWRAPVRALGRARDLYVRSVTGCARYVPTDAAFGYPVFRALPRSDSSGSQWGGLRAEDDLSELIRAASQMRSGAGAEQAVGRSQSMAMARIDEERPCDDFGSGGMLCQRSRSYVSGVGRAEGRKARSRVVALG